MLRHAEDEARRARRRSRRGCHASLDDVIAALSREEARSALRERRPRSPSALRAIDPSKRAKGGAGKWIVGGLVLAGAAAAAAVFVPQYLNAAPQSPAAPTTAVAPRPQTSDLRPQAAEPTPGPEARGQKPEASPPPAPPAPEAEAPVGPAVELAINSAPAGALVYREGETIPLGKTPFTATLLQSNKKTHLRFELDGYEPHPTDVKVDESHEVTVKLSRRPADVAPPPPTPVTPTPPSLPKKPSREGTIDPFAK